MEISLHMINYCVLFYLRCNSCFINLYLYKDDARVEYRDDMLVLLDDLRLRNQAQNNVNWSMNVNAFGTSCVLRNITSRVERMIWEKSLPTCQRKILESTMSTMSNERLKVALSKKLVNETCQPVTCTCFVSILATCKLGFTHSQGANFRYSVKYNFLTTYAKLKLMSHNVLIHAHQ